MQFQSLEEIFYKFNDLRILIVGDVMIDAYIWGKVERISPEAPVPVVTIKRQEQRLGGAANVALNVQSLGATPILCSVIGDDPEGGHFLQMLRDKHISGESILKSKDRLTTTKKRVLSQSQHVVRVDYENDHELTEELQTLLLQIIRNQLVNADAVIFEDYDKGVLNNKIIREIISAARNEGKPVIVDPKKRNFSAYSHSDLFKPNLKEVKEGLKIDLDLTDINQVEALIIKLVEELKVEEALVTLAERGVFIAGKNEKHYVPAHIRSIADVSGAGDTVVSIAALSKALKLPMLLTAELANLGGGIVCEYLGVVPVPKDRLYEEARRHNVFLDA